MQTNRMSWRMLHRRGSVQEREELQQDLEVLGSLDLHKQGGP